MDEMRIETDSLGEVEVPADKLWGAQTQRSLEHFSIGKDLIPREMITAYAILKKAAAIANHAGKRLDDQRYELIVQTCDEILGGPAPRHVSPARLDDGQRHPVQHERQRSDLQPVLPARRHSARKPRAGPSQRSRQHGAVVERLFSVGDVHRGGRQRESSGSFPRSRHCATRSPRRPSEWNDIVKIGRTHMQDATPLTLGPGMVRLCGHAVR